MQTDDIIMHLAEGDLAPPELADRLGVSLRDLAQWASEPENVRLLSGIAYIADVRAQLLLARYRANAAARLIAIATDQDAGELSRKACVDLLKTNLEVFAPRAEIENAPPPPPPPSEEAILEALERLGEK